MTAPRRRAKAVVRRAWTHLESSHTSGACCPSAIVVYSSRPPVELVSLLVARPCCSVPCGKTMCMEHIKIHERRSHAVEALAKGLPTGECSTHPGSPLFFYCFTCGVAVRVCQSARPASAHLFISAILVLVYGLPCRYVNRALCLCIRQHHTT